MKLKKADEMEMVISIKAMRLSWVAVVLALMAWVVVGYIESGVIQWIPIIIPCAQNSIFFLAKAVMTRRMVGDRNEEQD